MPAQRESLDQQLGIPSVAKTFAIALAGGLFGMAALATTIVVATYSDLKHLPRRPPAAAVHSSAPVNARH
jgi:hypothetical protein